MSKRLQDKVCVISGTGGSMGRAAALSFAREGAHIVGCDLNAEREEETVRQVIAAGGSMVSLGVADLTREEDNRKLIELAISTFGRIDVLYNNAAGGRFAWIEEMSLVDWQATFREEVDLVFMLSKAAWPHLKAQGGSVIVTASMSGKLGIPHLPQLAHAAAKAAVLGLVRQLAVEGGPFKIRVNSISPGVIVTNATAPYMGDEGFKRGMMSKILLGRFGQPEDIAPAALFLASDESAFMTGSDIAIDGGASAW